MKRLKHLLIPFTLLLSIIGFGQVPVPIVYYPEFNVLMNPSHSPLLEQASTAQDGNMGTLTPAFASQVTYLTTDTEPLLGTDVLGGNNYLFQATFGLDVFPYFNNSILNRSKPSYLPTLLLSATTLSERYRHNATDGAYLSASYQAATRKNIEVTLAASFGLLQHRLYFDSFPVDSLQLIDSDAFFETKIDRSLAVKIGYNPSTFRYNRPVAYLSFSLPSNRRYAELFSATYSQNTDFLFLSELWFSATLTEFTSLEFYLRTLHQRDIDRHLNLRNGIAGLRGRVLFFGFPIGLEAAFDWKASSYLFYLEVPLIFINPENYVYGKKNHFRHLRMRFSFQNRLETFTSQAQNRPIGQFSLMYGAF